MTNLRFLNIAFFFFAFTLPSLNAQIIYVKSDGTGNGSSWGQAKNDLRQTLKTAPKGSQIWVAKGTYSPTSCTTCTDADRRFSFEIPDSVAVFGGFSGTETALYQRNWKSNPTILSGNIDRDTTFKNNSFNVIFTKYVSKAMILDGFTISDGNANDTTGIERTVSGGGWYNDGRNTGFFSSPSVNNCIFQNNRAKSFGAAMINNAGFGGRCESVISKCTFLNNSSGGEGGAVRNMGLFNGYCAPHFSFCQFSNNHAGFAGGAVFNDGVSGVCNPTFTNCRFTFNLTDTYGGAMYNIGKSGVCSPTITNCLFWGNKAFSAAGIYCLGSEKGNSSPRITNCVFYKNEANTCSSVYANANDTTGKSAPVLLNCIIWGNLATTAPYIRSIESTPFLDYSIIDAPNQAAVFQGNINGRGACGTHVLYNQSPMFINPDNGDFRIIPPSPAINSGIDTTVLNIGLTVDLDSFPRIVGTRIDMGVFEYNPAFYAPPHLEQSPISATVCEREVVVLKSTFSGASPLFFQWYKNGVLLPNETNDSLKFSNGIVLSDSGAYKCIARNLLNIKDSSAVGNIKTKPTLPLSISLQASQTPSCQGDTVTLSATWANGGTRPKFDWRINDESVGLGDSVTTFKAAFNSIWWRYSCHVTTSEQCVLPRTAFSNEVQYMNIQPRLLPTIALSASKLELCPKETIVFTTTSTSMGATPQYQWWRNGLVINNLAATYRTDSLKSGDMILVIATSSERCLVASKVASNTVSPKVNLCNGVFENLEKQVVLFPNPSSENRFTLTGLDQFSGEKTVSVFNANGQLIFSKIIKKEEKEAVLAVPKDWANGLYWVKIATNERHFYKKWLFAK
jgi:hypothetical protein